MPELELAAADTLAEEASRIRRRVPYGPPRPDCANCGARLQGEFCSSCGQSRADYHRSIGVLLRDAAMDFFNVHSRLWRTVPLLVLRPARLTHEYLQGGRVRQVPPFRLFLLGLLVYVLAGETTGATARNRIKLGTDPAAAVAEARQERNQLRLSVAPDEKRPCDFTVTGEKAAESGWRHWVENRFCAIQRDPSKFATLLDAWAHRIAILTLPLLTALLSLVFAWRRPFMVFDHLVFAMHALTFAFLVLAAVQLGTKLTDLAGLGMFAIPVHAFRHLRGFYGLSRLGTVLRLLLLSWLLLFGGLLLILLWVGIAFAFAA